MKTSITIVKDFYIGEVDNNLFSSFIEHLGRAVYDGLLIYPNGGQKQPSGIILK